MKGVNVLSKTQYGGLHMFIGRSPSSPSGVLTNHRGGIGELGGVVNHAVIQDGTIGVTLVNHALDDAAPTADQCVCSTTEEELAKKLGLKPYTSRALAITAPEDVIQLPEELCGGWQAITQHFKHVGIAHANQVIWDNRFDVANDPEYKNRGLDTFYFGPDAHRVRPDAQRFFVTEQMNDKGQFLHFAQMNGVCIPQTTFFVTKEQVDDISHVIYPVVFKINRSVAGLGSKVCRTPEDLVECLKNVQSGIPFHLQKYLGDDAQFISAQYLLRDGQAHFVTASCNFIENETEHDGNWGGVAFAHNFEDPNNITFPVASAIAQMMQRKDRHKGQSCRGAWMGIDIGVTPEGEMFPIEANLRYTAAAYYYLTACKVGMQNQLWAGRSYASARPLSDIDLGDVAFTSKKGHGWILTNWGPLVVGKKQSDGTMKYSGGLLYVGPPDWEKYQKAEDALKALLT